MHASRYLIVVAVAALAGCASGIEPGGHSPSQTFDVAADYTAAYRRASEFVRVCHEEAPRRFDVTYSSTRALVEKTATGDIAVFKSDEPQTILETLRAKPDTTPGGPRASQVTVTVVGDAPWDAAEMEAARKSIQSAVPTCRPQSR